MNNQFNLVLSDLNYFIQAINHKIVEYFDMHIKLYSDLIILLMWSSPIFPNLFNFIKHNQTKFRF